jgi:hypothetical protein
VVTANSPSSIDLNIRSILLNISNLLLDLETMTFYSDGGESLSVFDSKGNELVVLAEKVIAQIENIV